MAAAQGREAHNGGYFRIRPCTESRATLIHVITTSTAQIGAQGRTRTYGVSHVSALQADAFATQTTYASSIFLILRPDSSVTSWLVAGKNSFHSFAHGPRKVRTHVRPTLVTLWKSVRFVTIGLKLGQ